MCNEIDFSIKRWSDEYLTLASGTSPKKNTKGSFLRVESAYTNLPVYPNWAYKGKIIGKISKESPKGYRYLTTKQTTDSLPNLEVGQKTSYYVQVEDKYGNPTHSPETNYISMGMKKPGKRWHRPSFKRLERTGDYELTLYEVIRGSYNLSSFLWKNARKQKKMSVNWDNYKVEALPTKVDPRKSWARTLNQE